MQRSDQHLVELYRQLHDSVDAVATERCEGSFSGTESCYWYHTAWPILRCLDLVSTPFWHRDFYEVCLRVAHSQIEINKIGILGTADFSMVDILTDSAARSLENEYSISVLDRCDTALWLNKKWSEYRNTQCSLKTRDLLTDCEANNRYQFAASDALLTRFDDENRRKVIANISKMISPSGFFCTTVRDHSTDLSVDPKKSRHSKTTYSKTAEALAVQMGLSRTEVKRVKLLADEYIGLMVSFPMTDINRLLNEFSNVGLESQLVEHAVVKGELQPTAYYRLLFKASE